MRRWPRSKRFPEALPGFGHRDDPPAARQAARRLLVRTRLRKVARAAAIEAEPSDLVRLRPDAEGAIRSRVASWRLLQKMRREHGGFSFGAGVVEAVQRHHGESGSQRRGSGDRE